jgi:hypothetical protein
MTVVVSTPVTYSHSLTAWASGEEYAQKVKKKVGREGIFVYYIMRPYPLIIPILSGPPLRVSLLGAAHCGGTQPIRRANRFLPSTL